MRTCSHYRLGRCMPAHNLSAALRTLLRAGMAAHRGQPRLPVAHRSNKECAPALLMGRGFSAAEPSSAATVETSLAAGLQAHA